MLRSLLLAFGLTLAAHSAAWAQAPLDFSELIDRRGVYLHRGTLEPYNGPVVAKWDSLRIRERGTLRNGRWDGVRETFYMEGKMESRETWQNGVLHGPFESYFRLGNPSDKGTYRDGRLDGPYESYWSRVAAPGQYGLNTQIEIGDGELAERGAYAAGEPCGEWYRFLPVGAGGMRFQKPANYPPCPAARE
jgi:antitoxin component YwqK of YwqJK toxin-antitoxin module